MRSESRLRIGPVYADASKGRANDRPAVVADAGCGASPARHPRTSAHGADPGRRCRGSKLVPRPVTRL